VTAKNIRRTNMARIIDGYVRALQGRVATVCLMRGGPFFDADVRDVPVRVGQDVRVELHEDGSAIVVGAGRSSAAA